MPPGPGAVGSRHYLGGLMRRHGCLLLPLLLFLNSCRDARLALPTASVAPTAVGLRPHSVAVGLLAVVGRRLVSPATCLPAAAVPRQGTQPEKTRTSQMPERRASRPQVAPPFAAPTDALSRQGAKSWRLEKPKPSTGWGKLKHFLGRLGAWTIYLTLVGLASWLVYLAIKWCFTLGVLGIVFGGLGAVMLTLLLIYFVVFFGFFALVSKTPM